MGTDHILPKRIYYGIFAILMVGTAITVVASSVDLTGITLRILTFPLKLLPQTSLSYRWSHAAAIIAGGANTIVALAIAVLKATLVVLFFMHVKYSTRLTWAVVLGSVFWLGIMLTLTMSDYLTRAWQTFG